MGKQQWAESGTGDSSVGLGVIHARSKGNLSSKGNPRKLRAGIYLFCGLTFALGGAANGGVLLGPLAQISTPDPFAACGSYYGYLPAPDAAVEPMLAVNPLNPANIVAVWCGHGMCGIGSSTTFDGGSTWLTQPLPDNGCGGGADPWVTFGPSGTVYSLSPFSRSTDGGLTWTSQGIHGYDRPSITSDPYNPNLVYAVWAFSNGIQLNNSSIWVQRSVDGGQTWLAAQNIHSASGTDFAEGPQIVVRPDRTVICGFCEGSFQKNSSAALSVMRSSDQGQTWSGPSQAPVQLPLMQPKLDPPNGLVTDPDTGHTVEAHPMFDSIAVDPNNGNLYVVWLDARFSNFQINAIAFSMSADRGFTWSTPVQINQTPGNLPILEQQAWNPTVQVAADGTVGVTYYDFRNNTPAPGCLTDYWLAYWRPSNGTVTNPANWNEVRLTDTSFDIEQAPGRSLANYAYLLGDYEGLASIGNGFASVWTQPYASSSDQILFREVTFAGK